MRRSRDGVGGYRGRRTVSDVLKWIAIVLGIVVALVLAGLVFGQQYIEYTDDGIRVELPFGSGHKEPGKKPDEVEIVEEPSSGEEEDADSSAGTEEEKPQKQITKALELPISAILDGTAAQKLEAAGANALVVEMKTLKGNLNWVSQEPHTKESGVNSTVAGINEIIRQFNSGDVYTIARVTCFADDIAPYYKMAMGLRSGGGNWRDGNGSRWLNPLSAEAQTYMTTLLGELSSLGFDEVLLEYAACPTDREGKLATADFSGSDFAGAISGPQGFLAKAKTALGDCKLSVRTQAGVLTGELDGGGLTAQGLEQYAYRIYLPKTEQDSLAVLTAAGITGGADRLVELTDAPAEGGTLSSATLNS